MFDKQQFEIPEAVRELAEKNVEQVRAAYGQFLDMAHKAQDMLAKSQGVLTSGAMELQQRAMKYAEENIDANFKFAGDLARARDLKEYVEIQNKYAREQMESYARQAQDLGKLMADAAKNAKP